MQVQPSQRVYTINGVALRTLSEYDREIKRLVLANCEHGKRIRSTHHYDEYRRRIETHAYAPLKARGKCDKCRYIVTPNLSA